MSDDAEVVSDRRISETPPRDFFVVMAYDAKQDYWSLVSGKSLYFARDGAERVAGALSRRWSRIRIVRIPAGEWIRTGEKSE